MDMDILSNLIIKKIYSVSTMYSEKNKKIKRLNRPAWAIIIKYEGETVYYLKGKSYISNINNMVILPKGCSYEWMCTEAGHFSIIEFDSDTVYDEILTFSLKNGEKMLNLFKETEYKWILKKPMYKMECIRDCYAVILKLAKLRAVEYQSTDKQKKLGPAMEYIAKNYNKNIKNDELALLTGFSTVYFRKLFTTIYGIPPIDYVHRLRIKKAKEMLKSDYGSITEIAQSLGYLNVYDFSRAFKKYTGIPPSKY